ncbi:MAG: ATP-binding protein, partial [Patescibacteria group bacterium]|nr:ATP-binding protein [Patescibacteria group bacterium]
GRLAARVDSEVFWRADGTPFPVEYTATPIKEGDRVAGAVVTFRDISEQRLLEAQLRQAQKLESIGQLAAGIAHEINTPTQYIGDNTRFLGDAFGELGAVLEYYARLLEAAKTGTVDAAMVDEVQRAAAEIDLEFIANEIPSAVRETLDGVAQVTKIVRSMKEFSHPGGDEKQPVDLNDAIRSTLTVSRNEWKYVADVVTDFDEELPMVMCMASDFNQVMLNLVVNAAHAIGERNGSESGQKGTVTIRTRTDGDFVEVRISDTGTGIPPAIRDRVFDPFFTTKEVGRGTGQGLAIAHSIITERHGGTIRLETEVGKGTEFIIRLPIEPKEAHHGAHSVCG